jgi:hypothetical protein
MSPQYCYLEGDQKSPTLGHLEPIHALFDFVSRNQVQDGLVFLTNEYQRRYLYK